MVRRCACGLDIILRLLFATFVHKLKLVALGIYYYQSESLVGIVCAQLLLRFYANTFETLQMFYSWSIDVHIMGYNPQFYFLFHVLHVKLRHFSDVIPIKVNRYVVGTLCAQLLLSFYDDSFETLQVLLTMV